ncbi:MAG: hypothetical protein AABO41_01735 [Acidobacteriota bacterium]
MPADYWDVYTQEVASVTADEVQRIARKYLDLDRLQIVAVGDASRTADVLKQYGTLEIYDTEGNRPRSSGGGK